MHFLELRIDFVHRYVLEYAFVMRQLRFTRADMSLCPVRRSFGEGRAAQDGAENVP
jgi:hypothetical protein